MCIVESGAWCTSYPNWEMTVAMQSVEMALRHLCWVGLEDWQKSQKTSSHYQRHCRHGWSHETILLQRFLGVRVLEEIHVGRKEYYQFQAFVVEGWKGQPKQDRLEENIAFEKVNPTSYCWRWRYD